MLSKMFLGKETYLDAVTEWRVKWSQRGIGTSIFFLGYLCYIVVELFHFLNKLSATMFSKSFRRRARRKPKHCVRFYNTNLPYSSALQEHIVCDDETTFKEPNVIINMMLSICNWAIDIGRPF